MKNRMRRTTVKGYTFGPQRATEKDGWRKLVRNEEAIMVHVAMLQRTIALTNVEATWLTFMQLPYYQHMVQMLGDGAMVRKVKAWWNLVLVCADSMELAYARMVLLLEVRRRKYEKTDTANPAKFGVSLERAGQLTEQVRRTYHDLVLGS